jgi:hypothetical protein
MKGRSMKRNGIGRTNGRNGKGIWVKGGKEVIQGVSGGILSILGGCIIDYSE